MPGLLPEKQPQIAGRKIQIFCQFLYGDFPAQAAHTVRTEPMEYFIFSRSQGSVCDKIPYVFDKISYEKVLKNVAKKEILYYTIVKCKIFVRKVSFYEVCYE